MEKIVYEQVAKYLEENKLIYEFQSFFRTSDRLESWITFDNCHHVKVTPHHLRTISYNVCVMDWTIPTTIKSTSLQTSVCETMRYQQHVNKPTLVLPQYQSQVDLITGLDSYI